MAHTGSTCTILVWGTIKQVVMQSWKVPHWGPKRDQVILIQLKRSHKGLWKIFQIIIFKLNQEEYFWEQQHVNEEFTSVLYRFWTPSDSELACKVWSLRPRLVYPLWLGLMGKVWAESSWLSCSGCNNTPLTR